MKKSLITLGVSAAVLCATNAMATVNINTNNIYVPVSFGVYQTAHGRHMNNPVYGSLGVGYNLNQLYAVQLSLGGFSPRTDAHQDTYNGYLLNLELKRKFVNSSAFTPFVTVGNGVVKTIATHYDVNAGLGVDYSLSPSTSLGLNYHLIHQFADSRNDSLYTFGVNFGFGASNNISSANQNGLTANQQRMLAKAQTGLHDLLPEGVVVCQGNQPTPDEAGCVTFAGNVMTMHLNVKFEQNMAVIRPEYTGPIAHLGTFMNAYPSTKAVLYGYASSEGPLAFNQALSLKRAQMVRNYLVNNEHVSASRLQAKGMGISNPIASNATEDGRVLNRRAEADVPVPVQVTQ